MLAHNFRKHTKTINQKQKFEVVDRCSGTPLHSEPFNWFHALKKENSYKIARLQSPTTQRVYHKAHPKDRRNHLPRNGSQIRSHNYSWSMNPTQNMNGNLNPERRTRFCRTPTCDSTLLSVAGFEDGKPISLKRPPWIKSGNGLEHHWIAFFFLVVQPDKFEVGLTTTDIVHLNCGPRDVGFQYQNRYFTECNKLTVT